MLASPEENKELGLVAPPKGIPEIDPKAHAVKLAKVDSNTYRHLLDLSEEERVRVKKVLKDAYIEWKNGTKFQNNKLLRAINRLEGIAEAKDYPWPDSSNLNIPYTEIQILVACDIVSSTMSDSDPMFFVREMLPARQDHPEEKVDPKIEWWLNWVFKKQLNLEEECRMATLLAFRDPLALLVMDWVEETPKEYSVQVFETVEEFQARFKDAATAGVSQNTYDSWMGQIGIMHEPLALEIEERVVRYRGPRARVVELKDFVRCPVTSPNLQYTSFHGDQFRERKPYFKMRAKLEQFYANETKTMLEASAKTKPIDDISQQLDTIEGITSNPQTPDEYDCIRGNLQMDLNNDGEDEMYHVLYNPEHDKLLRMERFPYWHNRTNYIPFRIRRKPNRLLGRCFVDMLYDINEEINTQHNQRIDSRTITTVPSFKINSNETDLLSLMDRDAYRFYPGCRFPLTNMNNLQQLETKVDFMGTLQEEQNLMGIGDMLTGTGSSGIRSGKESTKDPRASGKKTAQLLGQSNQRIDGYIRELKGAYSEAASQTCELYYQFAPDSVLDYASYDEATQSWVRSEIKRVQLRSRNMTIEVARTSVMDNPDSVLQRALTNYEIWSKEPLVGGNIKRRWELIRDTMFASKTPNIQNLLPPLKDLLEEMKQQDALASDPNSPPSHQALLNGVQEQTGGTPKGPTGRRQGSTDLRPSQLDRSTKGA